jgi:uncharacterized membrane protein YeaQ/YmgE (transglycosylase-associated protein family)
MMHYLYLALIGLIIGFIARALHPGKDNIGLIMTAVLGMAGSFLASFVGQATGLFKAGGILGFGMSVVGAIVLLVVYGMVAKKSGGPDGGSTST